MCIICVDLTKDKLTHKEARRNLGEMRTQIPDEHKQDVLRLIWKKEDEELLNDGYWDEWVGTEQKKISGKKSRVPRLNIPHTLPG